LKTLFIVNPAAAQGALGEAWASLAKGLKGTIRNFDFGFTRAAGDATSMTQEALQKGYELIVAVGGDGTLNECLNGFFKKGLPINKKACLGILPFGRGSDTARGLGIARAPEKAMRHLSGDKYEKLDVGCVTYTNQKGNPEKKYFINIANVGLVPHVVNWSHKSPHIFGSMGAYVYGALRGALEFKTQSVSIKADDHEKLTVKLMNLVVANGIYFGAGMKIAPRAKFDDGLLDILVIKEMPLLKFLRHLPDLYTGNHIKLKNIGTLKTRKINITPTNPRQKLQVEVDGDAVGYLPATFEVLPQVLRFKI
jgi:YegS/Rv2252/BmrU family lipid kinase